MTSITIPDSVTSIGWQAFFECSGLQSITIPFGVTNIERSALAKCSGLTSVTIPANVTTIEDYVFYDSKNVVISLYAGSYAEEYAKSKGIPYVYLDGSPVGGENESPAPIARTLSKITLSQSEAVYNGNAQTPVVTVVDANGQSVDPANYTVTYSNNQNVGQATVSVTGKNNYTGTVTATFNIVPNGTAISKVTAKKKAFTVKWKKQTEQTTGYELQFATSKKFKGAKTITVKKSKTASTTVKKLKAKKKYYVRIRTYKTVKINGKSTKLYSGWSKLKTIKVK